MDGQTPKAQRGQRVRITKGPRAGREGVVHKRCSASFPDRLYVTLDKSPRERKQKREQFGDDEVTVIGTGVSTGMPATTDAEWQVERQRHADALTAAEKEIADLRAEPDFLKRREQSIIEDCENMADGGKYRADIMSAIRRIRRERDENAAKVTALEAAQVALQDEVARLRREVLAAATTTSPREPTDEANQLRHALAVSQQDAIAARQLVRAQAETMTDERAAAEDAHLARIAAMEADVTRLQTEARAAANDLDIARIKADDLRAMYAAATLPLRVDVPPGLLFKPQEEWPCDGDATLFHHDEEIGLVRANGEWTCFLDNVFGKGEPRDDEPPCDAGARALLAHLDETDQCPKLAASDAEVTALRVRLRRLQETLDETREELRQARPNLQERLRSAITNLSNDAAEIDRIVLALRDALAELTDGETLETVRGEAAALAVLADRLLHERDRIAKQRDAWRAVVEAEGRPECEDRLMVARALDPAPASPEPVKEA